MGCRVSYVPLGELAEFESGGTPSKKIESYWHGSIPWISAKTLVGDTVYESDLTISKEGLESGSKLAPKGSLLLLTRGSGLFKRIPLAIAEKQVAYNQDIKCINSNAKGISNRYLFYALKAIEPAISAMLETTGIGAGKLATDRLKALPIPVLAEDARAKVTSIADCIYGKISLNAQLNGYLADAVDGLFEKALGQAEEKTLTDVVEILSGGTPKTIISEYWEDGEIPFFGPGDANGSTYCLTTAKRITQLGLENCNSELYPVDTVFLTARGTVGKVAMAGKPMAMNQSCFAFRGLGVSQPAVYQIIKRAVRSLKAKANGATFAAINTRDLKIEKILVPSNEELTVFEEEAASLHSMMRVNEEESLKLSSLRDALLPKLIAGEIDVSKIDLTQLNSHLA